MDLHKRIFAFLCGALVMGMAEVPARAAESSGTHFTKTRLYGEIDIIGSSCAAAGVTLSSRTLPTTVEKVRLGSPAFYAGVATGDRILSGQVNDRKVNLIIERNAQKFSVQLNTAPISYRQETPSMGFTGRPTVSPGSPPVVDVSPPGGSVVPVTPPNGPQLLPIPPHMVLIRMGLCGSWDAGGEGRQRWKVLAQELTGPGMEDSWRWWRGQVKSQVESLYSEYAPITGAASVHVVVIPDGQIKDVSEYDGPERPFADEQPDPAFTERLIKALRSTHLPSYPPGSSAVEAHVLIYVINRIAPLPGLPPERSPFRTW